jgi:Rrf2 family protein
MKLTLSVSYAVGILLRIAAGSGDPMTAAAISKGCRFPPRFLYRILRRLVDAGLLRGVSGPGGGYQLARPARQINLLEVVQAVEGSEGRKPLPPVTPRHRKAMQAIDAIGRRRDAAFRRELRKTSLERLARMSSP